MMDCPKCHFQMTELEPLEEQVLTFFKKEDGERKKVKFSLKIGGKKIGDPVIQGTIDRAWYCENCGQIVAIIQAEDF